MQTIDIIRRLYREAHDAITGTFADVTTEQAHWQPAGKALPFGAQFAHAVLGEDFILSSITGEQPLILGEWVSKSGLSETYPGTQPWDEWARRVQIDLDQLRAYAAAVYARTDALLVGLTEADLDREVPLFGRQMKIGDTATMLPGHTQAHCGEISCLKGLQGSKGYPF